MSPLAQRMLQDLQLAGLKERTHESYLRAVRKFAQWLKLPHLSTGLAHAQQAARAQAAS